MSPVFNHNIMEPPWYQIWHVQPKFRNPKYPFIADQGQYYLYTYLLAILCHIWNILAIIWVLIYPQIQNISLHMHAEPIVTQ